MEVISSSKKINVGFRTGFIAAECFGPVSPLKNAFSAMRRQCLRTRNAYANARLSAGFELTGLSRYESVCSRALLLTKHVCFGKKSFGIPSPKYSFSRRQFCVENTLKTSDIFTASIFTDP